jgi:hypothetical protein
VTKLFKHLFTDHPATVGENYLEHLVAATTFGVTMILSGLACIVHALIPGLFVTRGSDAICSLHERMVVKRRRVAEARASTAATL